MFISKFCRLGAHAMKSPAVVFSLLDAGFGSWDARVTLGLSTIAATCSPITYSMAHNQYLGIQKHVSFCTTAAKMASEGEDEKLRRYRLGHPLNATPKVSELRNIRDHKRRLLVARYEWRRKLYKALCKDPNLPSDVREKHRQNLSKLPRSSSVTRVRNRCVLTGRPRGGYRLFRMSRIVFRGLARQGDLPGIKKESW